MTVQRGLPTTTLNVAARRSSSRGARKKESGAPEDFDYCGGPFQRKRSAGFLRRSRGRCSVLLAEKVAFEDSGGPGANVASSLEQRSPPPRDRRKNPLIRRNDAPSATASSVPANEIRVPP